VCFCGVFPEINGAWASVDNAFFMWRSDRWCEPLAGGANKGHPLLMQPTGSSMCPYYVASFLHAFVGYPATVQAGLRTWQYNRAGVCHGSQE
jgi:hypothetical protein